MNDARDQTAASSALDSEPSSPGAWLKQERERQGMTTQRIAGDMHLSIAAVDAIESNRFAVLGAPVFAKGHLRKYAALLGLPGDKVVALYDRLEDAPRQVDPIPLSQRTPEPALRPSIRDMLGTGSESRNGNRSGILWLAVVAAAVIVVAGAGWSYLGYRAKQTTIETKVETSDVDPMPTNSAAVSEPPNASAERAPPVQTAPQSQPVAAAPAATVSTPRPQRSAGVPPPGKIRVRLTFARESWVEVYDSGGNRMLYGVGRVDLPRLIDVEPPVLIVLGDASAVTTEANDRVVTVPQKNISGTVARFAIAADGSVR